MLHPEVLAPGTLGILKDVLNCDTFDSFKLVGGTAFATTNNLFMLLKSITYFDDAELTEMPVLLAKKSTGKSSNKRFSQKCRHIQTDNDH